MTEIRVWPEQTCCERAHVEKRVNLPVVTGSNYLKIQEFYKSANRNYDALLSMGEADMLRGFVMSTLNKLLQERPDIARTDENWENWDMEASINNFQQWLKRHKTMEARRPFFQEKELCFNCGRTGPSAKFCRNRQFEQMPEQATHRCL